MNQLISLPIIYEAMSGDEFTIGTVVSHYRGYIRYTVMFNFPLYCPKCKKEIRIDVMQLKMAISK